MLVIVGIVLVIVAVALPSVPSPYVITGEILVSTSGPFSDNGFWHPGAGAFTDLNSKHPCTQPINGTCYSQWGEVFEPTETINLTRAVFFLWKVGSPNASLFVSVYDIAAGWPSTLIATSEVTVTSFLLTTGTDVSFSFTQGPTLTKGVSYAVFYNANIGIIDSNNLVRTWREKTCTLTGETPSTLIPVCNSVEDTSQDEDIMWYSSTPALQPDYSGDSDIDLGFQVWGVPPPAPTPPQIPVAQNYTFPTREQSPAEKFFTWLDKGLGQVSSPSLAGIRSVIGLVGIILSSYGLVRWKWS